jgi:hypothetical protein
MSDQRDQLFEGIESALAMLWNVTSESGQQSGHQSLSRRIGFPIRYKHLGKHIVKRGGSYFSEMSAIHVHCTKQTFHVTPEGGVGWWYISFLTGLAISFQQWTRVLVLSRGGIKFKSKTHALHQSGSKGGRLCLYSGSWFMISNLGWFPPW